MKDIADGPKYFPILTTRADLEAQVHHSIQPTVVAFVLFGVLAGHRDDVADHPRHCPNHSAGAAYGSHRRTRSVCRAGHTRAPSPRPAF